MGNDVCPENLGTAESPVDTTAKMVCFIQEQNPDYLNYSSADLSKLSDFELRLIMLAPTGDREDAIDAVPTPFREMFGRNALSEFNVALQQEAIRRGSPETFSGSIVESSAMEALRALDVPFTTEINPFPLVGLTLADGTTVETNAADALNYQLSLELIQLSQENAIAQQNGTYAPNSTLETSIPGSISEAIDAANIVPDEYVGRIRHNVTIGDEAAFNLGYATNAGAGQNIGPLSLDYGPQSMCQMDGFLPYVFDPTQPDVDVALAWAAGYIRYDMDQMTDEELKAVCPDARMPRLSGMATIN